MTANVTVVAKISELGHVITGRTPPSERSDYFGDACPFITPSDMTGQKVIRHTERQLSVAGRDLLSRCVVPARSVTVSCIGWQMGKAAITGARSVTNQQLNTIVPNERIDADFLYYSLCTRRAELKRLGSVGTRTPIVNKSTFAALTVEVPSLRIQRGIAGILSAYDDLIENCERRIRVLDEMARALYREWFVNFRYPGHEQVPTVGSPIGPIPKSWKAGQFSDLVTLRNDGTVAGSHLESRHYVPIECIPQRSLALQTVESWTSAQSSLQTFERDDILFGAMRPYFHKVVLAPFPGVTRRTVFVLRPRLSDFRSYGLLTAFRDETVAYATAHSRGATIPYAVWSGSMERMPVLLPSLAICQQFERWCSPTLQRIALSFDEVRSLRRTRDLLLPRLLSGQLSVADLAA